VAVTALAPLLALVAVPFSAGVHHFFFFSFLSMGRNVRTVLPPFLYGLAWLAGAPLLFRPGLDGGISIFPSLLLFLRPRKISSDGPFFFLPYVGLALSRLLFFFLERQAGMHRGALQAFFSPYENGGERPLFLLSS